MHASTKKMISLNCTSIDQCQREHHSVNTKLDFVMTHCSTLDQITTRYSFTLYQLQGRGKVQELCQNVTALVTGQKYICLAFSGIHCLLNTMARLWWEKQISPCFHNLSSFQHSRSREKLMLTLTQEYFFSSIL